MADVCRLYTVREDSGRGEVVYDLSALFADATSADGQRCIRIGRLQPISPAEGVPQNIATLCSRKHAELSVNIHALLLRDGGGINGTFVNDKRLPAHTRRPCTMATSSPLVAGASCSSWCVHCVQQCNVMHARM